MAFDRVVVGQGADAQSYSVREFMVLPLDQRIGHLLRREVAFFMGETPIDSRAALSSLRRVADPAPRAAHGPRGNDSKR